MANTKIFKEQLDTYQSDGAVVVAVTTQDKNWSVTCNDGGVTRTAIQVNGTEGSVTMPRQSYVYAKRITSSQTIANSTYTTVLFNSEVNDVLGEYDPATGIFTAKSAGIYSVNAQVTWNAMNANVYYQMFVYNGGTIMGGATHYTNIAYTHRAQILSCDASLAASGTIQVLVNQTSGVTRIY